MQPASARRAITRKGVAVGSVWERRMKMDELNGGIKVFNGGGECCDEEEGVLVYRRIRRNQSDCGVPEKRKRRSWRQTEAAVADGSVKGSPIQLRRARSAGIGCQSEEGKKEALFITDGKGNEEEGDDIEIEMEEPGKSFDDKEIDMPAKEETKVEEKKAIQVHETPVLDEEPPSMIDLKDKEQDPLEQFEDVDQDVRLSAGMPGTRNRMQHIVDLVMWRDVSKTAFFFGFGMFLLLSSSYAKEVNFSMISAISYTGLLYLAVIFLFRSIPRRAAGTDFQAQEGLEEGLIGEEEAIWIVRRVLPYLNELLSRVRSLFSGDPATTMKMAVILFVMAKCGSSLTVSTLAKLGFFGAFTIPRILSAYSVQIGRYGTYWLARFRDGWESCAHKKAVAAVVFTLIWNLSTAVARIWAVFMLIVTMRLYQQCLMVEGDGEEETSKNEQPQQQQRDEEVGRRGRGQRRPPGSLATRM